MDEVIKNLLISLVPSLASVIGSVSAAIITIFKVKSKLEESTGLKREMVSQNKKLNEVVANDEELKKELVALKLEIRGIKEHGKAIKKD